VGHDLGAQPQRPGELTATVVIGLDVPTRRYVMQSAASEGLPPSLWLAIAIEAQRCLSCASELLGVSLEELVHELDRAASSSWENRHDHPAMARLRAYASVVREGRRGGCMTAVPASLPLSPGLHVAAAWALQAEGIGVNVEQWASHAANALPAGRAAWEAASAAEGQPLAEWILVQAARRRRAASTSAYSEARC
jgi:hypothetical protein